MASVNDHVCLISMFSGVCHNLRSIIVKVSPSDYFEEPNSQEAQHLFGEILSTLKVCSKNDTALWLFKTKNVCIFFQVLQKRPGLCDVLRVRAEGFF